MGGWIHGRDRPEASVRPARGGEHEPPRGSVRAASGFSGLGFGTKGPRPQDSLWLCTAAPLGRPAWLSSTDDSTHDGSVVCAQVSAIEETARAGIWLWKAFRWIESRIPPPAP
jgi:hypothetical protein